MKLGILYLLFLMAGLCGCGGGSSTSAAVNTVAGVAAVGDVIVGDVYLKDSAATPKELTVATTDGNYSFNVTGMTKPFILKVVGTANGTTHTLYSLASDKGIANINPMAHLAVTNAAAGANLAALYAAPLSATMQAISAKLPQSVAEIQTSMKPMLEIFGSEAVNPITGTYKANHLGFDGMFDAVTVDIAGGVVTVASKGDSTIIFTAPVIDLTAGTVTQTNVPRKFISSMISGRKFTWANSDGVSGEVTFNANGTFTSPIGNGTWGINSLGQFTVNDSDTTILTFIASNATSITAREWTRAADGTIATGTTTLTYKTTFSPPGTRSTLVFTSAMLSSKAITSASPTDGSITFNLNNDGTMLCTIMGTSGTLSGTWAINSNGTLRMTVSNVGWIESTLVSLNGGILVVNEKYNDGNIYMNAVRTLK